MHAKDPHLWQLRGKSAWDDTLSSRDADSFKDKSSHLLLKINHSRWIGCGFLESQDSFACIVPGILGHCCGHLMGGGSAGPSAFPDSCGAAASWLAAAA